MISSFILKAFYFLKEIASKNHVVILVNLELYNTISNIFSIVLLLETFSNHVLLAYFERQSSFLFKGHSSSIQKELEGRKNKRMVIKKRKMKRRELKQQKLIFG